MAPATTNDLSGLVSRIGHYFSIVSLLPALFLVAWTAALYTSGAWQSAPDLKRMARALGGVNLAGAAWLVLATTIVALFLHPLQLAMTRLLEGYWGSSRLATALLRRRITHHRRRRLRLLDRQDDLLEKRDSILMDLLIDSYRKAVAGNQPHQGAPESWEDHQLEKALTDKLASRKAHPATGFHAAWESIPSALKRYPASARMLPTRLGNALRSAEDTIGKQYGLDAITVAPHLTLIAPEAHLGYIQDTRQQMDTTVRLCVAAFAATIETTAWLLTSGWPLLIALVPYLLCYIGYRASVAAADDYMTIIRIAFDLNRFKLYESLHLEAPRNTAEERWNNEKLMKLIDQNHKVSVRYQHPPTATPAAGATPPATPPGNP